MLIHDPKRVIQQGNILVLKTKKKRRKRDSHIPKKASTAYSFFVKDR
jgi:hypothetical protein